MMMPKVIYELLPYVCMVGGLAEVTYFKTIMTTGSGLLFYGAGALMWILRSNHRRTDPQAGRKLVNDNQSFYELKPFFLIAIGVLLFTWLNTWMALPLSALTAMLGTYIIVLRSMHRRKKVSFSRHSL